MQKKEKSGEVTMRDITKDLLHAEDYPKECEKLVEDFNEALYKYQKDTETFDVVYEILGAKPWTVDFDGNGNISSCIWSEQYRRQMGFDSETEFPNTLETFFNQLYDEDKEYVFKEFMNTVRDKSGDKLFDVTYRAYKKDGTLCWFHSAGKVRRHKDGTPITFVGMSNNVTEKMESQTNLQEQYEIVEALSRDYLNIFLVDIEKKTASIIKLDGYVTEGYGDKSAVSYPYDAFASKYINDRVYPKDQEGIRAAMQIDKVKEMLEKNDEYIYSYRTVDKGEVHFYQFTYLSIRTRSGKKRVIAGFKNIDATVESAKEREELKHLSETDIMTKVFNRGYGEKRTTEVVREGRAGMFCIMDMDRFKEINDTFGHGVGDKVLIQVADCLKQTFAKEDIIFRLGGDEFSAAAFEVSSVESGKKLLKQFFDKVRNIRIEELGDFPIYVSVGAVLFDHAEQDFEEVYREADRSVYVSKKTEGNIATFYEEIES